MTTQDSKPTMMELSGWTAEELSSLFNDLTEDPNCLMQDVKETKDKDAVVQGEIKRAVVLPGVNVLVLDEETKATKILPDIRGKTVREVVVLLRQEVRRDAAKWFFIGKAIVTLDESRPLAFLLAQCNRIVLPARNRILLEMGEKSGRFRSVQIIDGMTIKQLYDISRSNNNPSTPTVSLSSLMWHAVVQVPYHPDKPTEPAKTIQQSASVSVKNDAILTLFVKTLHGSTISLDVASSDTIEAIKTKIQAKEGVSQGLRLTFAGKELTDRATLAGCNIKTGSTVHMLLRLKGGGGSTGPPVLPFVDVSNSQGIQRVEWSKRPVPAWHIAQPGRCMEGICTNALCEAYGQWIICNIGFGTWDLHADQHLVHCPVCLRSVQPQRCAFNNCVWRYKGMRKESLLDPQSVERQCAWQKADNAYHVFDPSIAGTAFWLYLMIEAAAVPPVEDDSCPVCLDPIGAFSPLADYASRPISTKCGHRFHHCCLQAWKAHVAQRKSSDSLKAQQPHTHAHKVTCPLCRAVID